MLYTVVDSHPFRLYTCKCAVVDAYMRTPACVHLQIYSCRWTSVFTYKSIHLGLYFECGDHVVVDHDDDDEDDDEEEKYESDDWQSHFGRNTSKEFYEILGHMGIIWDIIGNIIEITTTMTYNGGFMLVLHGLTWLNRDDSGIMIGITMGIYRPVSSAPWLAMGIYTLENHRAMRFHGNAYQSVYSDCNVGNPTIDHTSLTLTFGAFANHNPEKRVHLVHYWVYHKNNCDFMKLRPTCFNAMPPGPSNFGPRKRISWFGTWSWTWKQWMISFEIRKKQVQSGLWRMCPYLCGTQES